jgi:hypothetical protein
MRVNRDSRGWIIVCLISLAASAAFYSAELSASAAHGGPSGGSWYGIIFGSFGSAMMLFALLLGLKKRFRTLRVGRAYHWMQGHVWLGLLSYPVILFHCGFHWGGVYTQLLMWLFTIVVISGIIGLIIQQYMPAKIFREVHLETIYEQIDHVTAQLRDEAESIMSKVRNTSGDAFEMEVLPAGAATATLPETNAAAARTLNDFYNAHIKPYLADSIPRSSKLRYQPAAELAFEQVRTTVPQAMHVFLDDLAEIASERRELGHQRHMHHIMHGWLLVHVPLSYALIVLSAWHAVYALRFVTPHW